MLTEIQNVPLNQLRLSGTGAQTERRKLFDKVALTELAESLKTFGLLQPIVARRSNGTGFEIVAGERRFAAAKIAGLKEVAVSVRDLTDEQVLEVQLVENLQREGLHELVEAEGYEALMKQHQYTVEDLVAKVGKSRGYVYGRLKLTALCKDGRASFHNGDLTASTAQLIARIPGEDQQQRALKHITEKDWQGRLMSYREALRYVQETFHLKLSDAPFATDDATLVPAAGACGGCPMRTGNQPELFGDVKSADVCTNPPCFQSKKAAHIKRQLEKATADGDKVIRGNAATRILPDGRGYWGSTDGAHKQLRNGYARPNDKCLSDPKKRTYAELAGKDAQKVLLQHPDSGRVEKIFRLEDIKEQLKAKGIKPEKPAADHKQAQERDREADKLRQETELAERAAIAKACMRAAPAKLEHAALARLVAASLDRGYHGNEELWTFMGWGKPSAHGKREEALLAKLRSMTPAALAQVALVTPLIDHVFETYDKATNLEALAKELGVNVKAVRASVAPPVPPKAEPKKKSAKKK